MNYASDVGNKWATTMQLALSNQDLHSTGSCSTRAHFSTSSLVAWVTVLIFTEMRSMYYIPSIYHYYNYGSVYWTTSGSWLDRVPLFYFLFSPFIRSNLNFLFSYKTTLPNLSVCSVVYYAVCSEKAVSPKCLCRLIRIT